MENRDKIVLDHIGRYTISIRRIIEDHFFASGSCATTLDRLIERQLIQRITKALQGNYSYYQLTPKGAKGLGLPPNKAVAKGELALAQNLAALWFSCTGDLSRKRLAEDELQSLFGAPDGGNIIHVAQCGSADQTTVFRLFIPGENTAVKRGYARALRKTAIEAMDDKRLGSWIDRGTYGFAVLVHSAVRREELERLIRAEDFPRLRLQIEIAPTPSTLPAFLPNRDDR